MKAMYVNMSTSTPSVDIQEPKAYFFHCSKALHKMFMDIDDQAKEVPLDE